MKFYKLFIFLFLSYHLNAQNLNIGHILKTNYYTKIKFEYTNNQIIVPVTVENKTYRFLLDTGATSLISANLKNNIKTTPLDKIPITDTNDKTDSLEVVTIPHLKLGNISFENTAVLVHELKTNKILYGCSNIDGIIGSNILRNSIIKILLNKRLIEITDNKNNINLNKKNAIKLSLLGIQSMPFIWINIKGKKNGKSQVLFDTGSNVLYDIALKDYLFFKERKVYNAFSEGEGSNTIAFYGNTNKTNHYRIEIPQIKLGNSIFKNITAVTTDDKFSRIGVKLLEYGNVTIDFINKRFYFDSFQKSTNLLKKIYGFSPTIINKKLVVGIIWNKELRGKIKYGNEILEINGVNFQNIDQCEIIKKLENQMSKESLELLIINSENKIIKLNIKKKLPPTSYKIYAKI